MSLSAVQRCQLVSIFSVVAFPLLVIFSVFLLVCSGTTDGRKEKGDTVIFS